MSAHDHQRSLRGVLLGFTSFAFFALSDASVKLIRGELPAYESAFFGAVCGLTVLPFLLRPGDRWSDIFRTADWRLWFLRFFAFPAGVIGSVTAFTHLSMAEAFVLIFLLPAFVTLMSVFFLKEQVGIRRWSAVATGFVGVLIVLRPGFRQLGIGHVGAIFAGLGGAVSVVCFRAAGATEKRVSLLAAGTLGGVLVCGALTVPHFVVPNLHQWLELASYGLLAAIANVIMMHAALSAPATLIGPTQYSQMLWAILLGYLLFGDRVDAPMLAGMVLIIGSGLLTLLRENTRGTPLPPSVAGERNVAAALASRKPGPGFAD
jgi:drug/metabolite transporter (DMT)-like permease